MANFAPMIRRVYLAKVLCQMSDAPDATLNVKVKVEMITWWLCYVIWVIIPSIEDSSGRAEPFHIPRCAPNIWQTYGSGSQREEDVGAGIDSRTPWIVNGKLWKRKV